MAHAESGLTGDEIASLVAFINPLPASENAVSRRADALISTGLWAEGAVVFRPGGPGFVTTDGALGMKWGWRRGVRGQLRIEGRRATATR